MPRAEPLSGGFDGPPVVPTYPPSHIMSVAEGYATTQLTAAFALDCGAEIENSTPATGVRASTTPFPEAAHLSYAIPGYRKEATRLSNIFENAIFFPHEIIDVPLGAETSNWRAIVASDNHRYDSCYENSFGPLTGHAAAKEQPDDRITEQENK